jgi:carbonic anhydrase
MKKIVSGILRFKIEAFEARRALFAELATGQDPEVLFITCADSRIDPCLVTQTEPGDLFICRNAGNIVPPHQRMTGGVTASIEFAVAGLGIRDVVICGHTDCGAISGALNPDSLSELPHVHDWLEHVQAAVDEVKRQGIDAADEQLAVTRANVVLQLEHLKTHPCIASRLGSGDVSLHGWLYDIEAGVVTCYDESTGTFVALEERYSSVLSSQGA